MSAMAGNLPAFRGGVRALFADDRRRFDELIAGWPADIRDHVVKLAYQRLRRSRSRIRLIPQIANR